MRVYISGPITGIENGNFEAFAGAEASLYALGHSVVNPHALPHNHGKTWQDYMREDLRALLDCDAVFTLPGWQMSRGASIEVKLAKDLGMMIFDDLKKLGDSAPE